MSTPLLSLIFCLGCLFTVVAAAHANQIIVVAIEGFELAPEQMDKDTWSIFQKDGAYTLSANRVSWETAFSGNDRGDNNLFERTAAYEATMKRFHETRLDRFGKDFTSAILTSWPHLRTLLKADEVIECPPYTPNNPPICHPVNDVPNIIGCSKACAGQMDEDQKACAMCAAKADDTVMTKAIDLAVSAPANEVPNLLLVYLRAPWVAASAKGWRSDHHKTVLHKTEVLVGRLVTALTARHQDPLKTRLDDTLLMVLSASAPPPADGEAVLPVVQVPTHGPWLVLGSTVHPDTHLLTARNVAHATMSVALCSLGFPVSEHPFAVAKQVYGEGAHLCRVRDKFANLSQPAPGSKELELQAEAQIAARVKALFRGQPKRRHTTDPPPEQSAPESSWVMTSLHGTNGLWSAVLSGLLVTVAAGVGLLVGVAILFCVLLRPMKAAHRYVYSKVGAEDGGIMN